MVNVSRGRIQRNLIDLSSVCEEVGSSTQLMAVWVSRSYTLGLHYGNLYSFALTLSFTYKAPLYF